MAKSGVIGVGVVVIAVGVAGYLGTRQSHTSGGFNASKTVFVLPHNLGDLPAPELALAKNDPAYAAGLLTPADWVNNTSKGSGEPLAMQGWFYIGSTTGSNNLSKLMGAKTAVTTMWIGSHAGPNNNTSAHFSIASSTPIVASQLNSYRVMSAVTANFDVLGYTVVTPSVLEVRAAPVGTMSVNGTSIPAFCTPTPEGILQNGHVVTPGGINLTAGPSAVFTDNTVPSSQAAIQAELLYDQGVSSCAGFN